MHTCKMIMYTCKIFVDSFGKVGGRLCYSPKAIAHNIVSAIEVLLILFSILFLLVLELLTTFEDILSFL